MTELDLAVFKGSELPPTIQAHCHMLGWLVRPVYPFTKAKNQRWEVTIERPFGHESFCVDGTRFTDWLTVFKQHAR